MSIKQVGGDHYQLFDPQLIDVGANMPYIVICFAKYLFRWPFKGKPVEDLQKARSLIDEAAYCIANNFHRKDSEALGMRFVSANRDKEHLKALVPFFDAFRKFIESSYTDDDPYEEAEALDLLCRNVIASLVLQDEKG